MAEKTKKTTKSKTVKSKAVKKAKTIKEAPANHASGFVDFIRKQGVVGLAIGLAIGTAAGSTVRALVDGFINPIVQFIVGSQTGLELATWHVELWGRKADFHWGMAVSSVITLIATALVIYWLVHVFKLDKLDKPKD